MKLPVPLDVPPTVTTTVPVEPANVESPEYVAVITWEPDVVDEKLYVAEPFERAREEVSVVPSTATVNVPVGVVVTELEPETTVIVMISLAPEAGEVVVAESVVRDAPSEDEDVVGQAVRRL